MNLIWILSAALLALPCWTQKGLAQKYEVGAQGGVSLYQSKQISAARATVDAGFSHGWTAGITVGHDMYPHVGGEVRYSYLNNGMKLTAGQVTATFGGQAHAIHYDLLIHGTGPTSRLRPYVAFGGGAKIYRGTGAEQAFQPLSNVAILTKTQETQGLASIGGGVKFRLSEKLWFRLDVHDYLTPFPKKVITPATGSAVSGWLNNIVPTAGLIFTF